MSHIFSYDKYRPTIQIWRLYLYLDTRLLFWSQFWPHPNAWLMFYHSQFLTINKWAKQIISTNRWHDKTRNLYCLRSSMFPNFIQFISHVFKSEPFAMIPILNLFTIYFRKRREINTIKQTNMPSWGFEPGSIKNVKYLAAAIYVTLYLLILMH